MTMNKSKLYSVYRNLNNGKLSVRNNKGLVVGHCDAITLIDVKFKVNKKGVERIRKTKRKEVVGVACGRVMSAYNFTRYKNRESIKKHNLYDSTPKFQVSNIAKKIFFNPYKNNSFVCQSDSLVSYEIAKARLLAIDSEGRMLGLVS